MQPENIIDRLDESSNNVQEAIRQLTPQQTVWKSSEAAWSVIQCCEHIWLVEKDIVRLIGRPGPLQETPYEGKKVSQSGISRVMQDRSQKYTVPDQLPLHPSGQFQDLNAFWLHFLNTRDRLKQTLENIPWQEDQSVFPHPRLGPLTKSDWLHFLVEHTNRHIAQIREIRSHAEFPSS